MMENRTYDSLFGRYPLDPNGGVATLPQAADPFPGDIDHSGPHAIASIDGGRMDEFAQAGIVQYGAADVPIYWSYAQNFGLGDNFFSSMAAPSQPNHIALIAGQTDGADFNGGNCNSPANAIMFLRAAATGAQSWGGSCFNINALPDVLSQYGISWRYYYNVAIWNGLANIAGLVNSPYDIHNPDQFLTDVQTGNLATVSWVTPRNTNSDHPPQSIMAGQDFIAQEVSAIMQSPYWNNTVIFVTWDDWGGFYDHVNPQALDADGLGLRAPLLVISPYAKPGYISHNLGEFSSFLKFIEQNWGLPNLGQRDSLPTLSDLTDFFDFTQAPLAPVILTPIPYSTAVALTANLTGVGTEPAFPEAPAFGTTKTTFTYSITYTQTDTPSVVNVIIDGVPHPMTKGAVNSAGQVYQYSTKLGIGTHNYSFFVTDSQGVTTVLPFNNTTYAGPVVGTVSLDTITVSPGSAMPGQSVSFSVRYTSTTNTAPTRAQIQLDGITYDMTPTGSLNYSTGVTYTYTTTALGIGDHYSRFVFDEGTGPWILEGGDTPEISPITITGPGVSPATGTASTTFTFQATYTSVDGTAPTNGALVYIDNVAHLMTYVSGTSATGALYQYQTTLAAGTHIYFFLFANATGEWASPIYPANYSMTVTSSASAGAKVASNSVGHTVVAPSHSEDPDQVQYPVDPAVYPPRDPNQPPVEDDD
jgi:phospholipase C